MTTQNTRSYRDKLKKMLRDLPKIALAAFLFAISVNMFVVPGEILLGGVTGIANTVHIITGFKYIGLIIFVINVPMAILSWKSLGREFIFKTIIGFSICSLFIDVMALDFFASYFPPIGHGDLPPLISAVMGGALMGCGMGLLFSIGYTTGGVSMLVMLIRKKTRRISTGTLIIIFDVLIIALSLVAIFIFKGELRVETLLSTLVFTYVTGFVTDKMIFGARRSKIAIIISGKSEEIAAAITLQLDRGITVISAKGYYSGEDRQMLLCAVAPRQMFQLKSIIMSTDSSAFVMLTDASEIVGEGFLGFGD